MSKASSVSAATPQSLSSASGHQELDSHRAPGPGANKVGNHCFKGHEIRDAQHDTEHTGGTQSRFLQSKGSGAFFGRR